MTETIRISITTFVTHFLDHGRYVRGWSPRTVQCYQHALATFTPERITKQTRQQFVASLLTQGHNPGRLVAFKPRGRAMKRAHTLLLLLLDTGTSHHCGADTGTPRCGP